MIVTTDYANALDPVVRKSFFTAYDDSVKQTDFIQRLCTVEKSSRSIERVAGFGGMADIPDFDGAYSEEKTYEQYMKTFTHTAKGAEIILEKQLLEDDLLGIVKQTPRRFGKALFRTHQKLLADVFNTAFVTANGSDAVCLCSASHPSKSPDGATQSNVGSTALSTTSLIATLNLMNQFRDDRGELMSSSGNLLLVPLGLRQTALEITGSDKEPYTPDNTINVAKNNINGSKVDVLVWNRLTDSNNWFLIDTDIFKEHTHWFNRMGPELDKWEDKHRRAFIWSIYWRGAVGYSDWRGIYGHLVA